MRTANPALSDRMFVQAARSSSRSQTDIMTVEGTCQRIAILLGITSLVAIWAFEKSYVVPQFAAPAQFVPSVWMMVGGFGGFIVALVTIFKQVWAPYTAPLYALLEGLFLGGISASFEVMFPGIALQAILGTFGTLLALLIAYRSGAIEVTDKFRMGVAAATGGIALLYFVGFILSFFGMNIPLIHESGMVGIGFSLLVVGVAALNLVLDFDFIERGASMRAPRYMEWYAAFGLLVTLVWLYIEMLRLLAKLRSSDD